MPSNPPKDPVLMGMLSGCCIAGLGQVVLGQITKGIVLLLFNVVIVLFTAGFAALVTWPLMGIDAYLIAKKLRSGQPVGEWEFFPSS
jgi:TM2 domain-containing membrane protein YozV